MPKTVFLDTHVFDTHLFDFDSPLLENFRSFASTGLINVVTTDITCWEIETRITDKVRDSLQSLNKWLKERDSGILRHVGDRFAILFAKAKPDDIAAILKRKFREFLESTHTTIIPTGTIDGAQLVAAYFGAIAPFGPGRKKEQFPYAIAIAVLREWCERNECTVEVVSGDGDWKRACDGCKWLKHTAELKELLSGLVIVAPAVTDALVDEALKNRRLPAVIANYFKDSLFSTSSDQGTVAEVDDVEVTIDGHTIVYAPDGPSTIEVMCRISFRAKVVYELSNTSDSATADWDTFDPDTKTFHQWIKQSVSCVAQVSIVHDGKDPGSVQIENVEFDYPAVIVNWPP